MASAVRKCPLEVLVMIFRDFGFTDLDHCMLVCLSWKAAILSSIELKERLFLVPVRRLGCDDCLVASRHQIDGNTWYNNDLRHMFQQLRQSDNRDACDYDNTNRPSLIVPARSVLLNPLLIDPGISTPPSWYNGSGAAIIKVPSFMSDIPEVARTLQSLAISPFDAQQLRWLEMFISQPPIVRLAMKAWTRASKSFSFVAEDANGLRFRDLTSPIRGRFLRSHSNAHWLLVADGESLAPRYGVPPQPHVHFHKAGEHQTHWTDHSDR